MTTLDNLKRRIGVCSLFMCMTMFITAAQQTAPPKPAPQNPSPMTEHTRQHERVLERPIPGTSFRIEHLLPRPAEGFIPAFIGQTDSLDLLIHFHGAAYLVRQAASDIEPPMVALSTNLGAGSRVYSEPFEHERLFHQLLDSTRLIVSAHLSHPIHWRRVILTAFSAGYGAIREIISSPQHYTRVDAILLLDGLHASYIPERTVLAEGGRIDSIALLPFLRYAEDAMQPDSKKRFLITHSEIFPGTFVSTTEATDYLLNALGLMRKGVLEWGPLGMQQLSETKRGRFAVLGFAGNAGPDHIDHLHALQWFLSALLEL